MEHVSLLWAERPDGEVWLERRPAAGVWGGLYCFPVFDSDDALLARLPQPLRDRVTYLPPLKHVLTHKDMHLSPVIAGFSAHQKMPLADDVTGGWFLTDEWPELGLPAPIRKLLENTPDRY